MKAHRPNVIYRADEGVWVAFHSIPVRIVATGEQTGGAFTVCQGMVKPGGGPPPHRHTFDEGFWVMKGTVEFTAGNQKVQLTAGDFIQIRGGNAHYLKNVGEEEAELLTICAPSGFDEFQMEIGESIPGREGPFPTPAKDVGEKMKSLGPDYGIEIAPPESAFEEEPDIIVRRAGEGDTIAVVGDVYRFLVKGTESGGTYALWHATVYPGGGPPPHIHHKEEEFFYVLSGELTIADDEHQHSATAGTAVVLPRYSRHWFRNETDQPAEMLILVAPAGLEDMFSYTGVPWTIDQGAPEPPSDAEKARLGEVAAQYGLKLG